MPANIVKTKRDERLWREAKRQAKREHKSRDWDYIMGVFLRMKYHLGGKDAKRPWKKYLKKKAQTNNPQNLANLQAQLMQYYLQQYSKNMSPVRRLQEAALDTLTTMGTYKPFPYEYLPEYMQHVGMAAGISPEVLSSQFAPKMIPQSDAWAEARNIFDIGTMGLLALPFLKKLPGARLVGRFGSKLLGKTSLPRTFGKITGTISKAVPKLNLGLKTPAAIGRIASFLPKTGRLASLARFGLGGLGALGAMTAYEAAIGSAFDTGRLLTNQRYLLDKTTQLYKDINRYGRGRVLLSSIPFFGQALTGVPNEYSMSHALAGVVRSFLPGEMEDFLSAEREKQRTFLINRALGRYKNMMRSDRYLKDIQKAMEKGVLSQSEAQGLSNLRKRFVYLPRMKKLYQGLMQR